MEERRGKAGWVHELELGNPTDTQPPEAPSANLTFTFTPPSDCAVVGVAHEKEGERGEEGQASIKYFRSLQ